MGVLLLPLLGRQRQNPIAASQFAAGTALTFAGVLLRIWAAGVLHKHETLCTNGPYSLLRHPLYAGSGLIACGHGLLSGVRGAGIWFPLSWFLVYRPAMQAEEQRMEIEFAEEYSAFAQETGALFPKRLPNAEKLARFSPRQAWRNREYEAVLVNALLVLIYNALNRARSR